MTITYLPAIKTGNTIYEFTEWYEYLLHWHSPGHEMNVVSKRTSQNVFNEFKIWIFFYNWDWNWVHHIPVLILMKFHIPHNSERHSCERKNVEKILFSQKKNAQPFRVEQFRMAFGRGYRFNFPAIEVRWYLGEKTVQCICVKYSVLNNLKDMMTVRQFPCTHRHHIHVLSK